MNLLKGHLRNLPVRVKCPLSCMVLVYLSIYTHMNTHVHSHCRPCPYKACVPTDTSISTRIPFYMVGMQHVPIKLIILLKSFRQLPSHTSIKSALENCFFNSHVYISRDQGTLDSYYKIESTKNFVGWRIQRSAKWSKTMTSEPLKLHCFALLQCPDYFFTTLSRDLPRFHLCILE